MPPDTGLVLARFAALALLLALAGIPLYLRIAGQVVASRALCIGLAVLAAGSALASLWWAAASVAAMAAMPLAGLDREILFAVLSATPLGDVLIVRLAVAACLLIALALTARTLPAALIAFPALASSAWTGHAGATEGMIGTAHRAMDVVHLGAAAVWLGALCVFVMTHFGAGVRRQFVERLSAFARTGTVVVIALAVTGLANALLITRNGWSATSGWSLLLAVKICFFLAMLGFAALNRWRLAPAFERGTPGAARRLGLSLTLETASAFSIVLLVAVFGMLDPSGG